MSEAIGKRAVDCKHKKRYDKCDLCRLTEQVESLEDRVTYLEHKIGVIDAWASFQKIMTES